MTWQRCPVPSHACTVNVTGASTGSATGIPLDWRTIQGHWGAYVVWADGGGNVKPCAYMSGYGQEHVRPRHS